MNKTLTVAAVAALHQIPRLSVHRAIAAGHLKAQKLPGGQTAPYVLTPTDVDDWLARRAANGAKERPGSTGFFAALAQIDSLPTLIEEHHSITADLPLADVVIACACSPEIERDAGTWAIHLRDVMAYRETSGATAPVEKTS